MVKVTFETPEITMTRFIKWAGMCSEYNLVHAITELVAAYDAASPSTYKIRKNLIEALKDA
jgi:hypothetical protein